MKLLSLFLLSTISLAFGRHHTHQSRSDILKRLLQRKYKDDIYFGGENSNDGQPEITAADLPNDGELFEGDLIMDDSLRRTVLGDDNKRSAIVLAQEGMKRHWPKGEVPYKFDEENILPIIKEQIKKAIKIFSHYTCIRFVPKQEKDDDYVLFTSDTKGCASSVGRAGGEQKVHLGSGCTRIGTVVHEMMHTLGIFHEQSRPDRDEHLTVNFDNIKPKLVHNFRKYSRLDATNLDVEYNFNSVMHYSPFAFSKNGKRTLVSNLDSSLEFGQREKITRSDVQQINNLYKCHVEYDEDKLLNDMTDDEVLRNKRERLEREEEEEQEEEFVRKFVERLDID